MTEESRAFGELSFCISDAHSSASKSGPEKAIQAVGQFVPASASRRTSKSGSATSFDTFDNFDSFRETIVEFSTHLCDQAGLFCTISEPMLRSVHYNFVRRREIRQMSDFEEVSFLKIMSLLLSELASRDWLVELRLGDGPHSEASERVRTELVRTRPSTYIALMFILSTINQFQATQILKEGKAPSKLAISGDMLQDVLYWLQSSSRDDQSTYVVLKALYSQR